MRTGIILLGHRSGGMEETIAEGFRKELESRGRKDVLLAFQVGSPDPGEVMARMHRDGIDTFSIVPLCIAEGDLTVWRMPKSCGLPDNSGSWTIIDGKDVATRFATAMGPDTRIMDALSGTLGEPDDTTGILILLRGSRLSMAGKTAGFYVNGLSERGWKVASCTLTHGGPNVEDVIENLMEQGCETIRVVPMFIAMDGPSASGIRKVLETMGPRIVMEPEISRLPEFLDVIDSKIPEGW